MEFSPELRGDVLSGEITVSFRLWRRPMVKAGGSYRVGDGRIEVDLVEVVPFSAIDEADVYRAGEADLESLRRAALPTPAPSTRTRSSTGSSSTSSEICRFGRAYRCSSDRRVTGLTPCNR